MSDAFGTAVPKNVLVIHCVHIGTGRRGAYDPTLPPNRYSFTTSIVDLVDMLHVHRLAANMRCGDTRVEGVTWVGE